MRVTAAVLVAVLIAGASLAASGDVPPSAPNPELVRAGSLVIPMDGKQNLGGTAFNLKAYGLVTRLLWAEIPVQWAIRSGKGKNEADFSALATRLLPSVGSTARLDFSGGPFIVPAKYARYALPFFTGTFSDVAVYRLEADVTVDVRFTLHHKPKVAVLDDGGNADIHSDILADAGFTAGTHFLEIPAATLTTINANSCFTMATEAHCGEADCGPAQVQAIREFATSGGNFLAQCAAILPYENDATAGRFQTTAGLASNANATTFAYPSPDLPYSQFEGALSPISGSTHDFFFAPGSAFRPGAHAHVQNSGADVYRATLRKLIPGDGGLVHYLGGHEYDDGSLGEANGRRMYLNAVLTPALRPPPCNLTFDLVRDARVRVLEDVDGDGSLTDGVPRSGVVVRFYRDGGDGVPTGADDALVSTATTGADGIATFLGLDVAYVYWAAVDSTTVVPSAPTLSTTAASSVWAEQTHGPDGARCDDGAGGARTLSAAGSCYGGRSAETADAAATLAGSEHVVEVVPAPGTTAPLDFGFSFATIVNTRDAIAVPPARSIQGSLRQFLQNSEAIQGEQRSVFRLTPGSPGFDGARWRITAVQHLPVLLDPLSLDGSTQTGFATKPLVELDGAALFDGLVVQAGSSTIRGLAIGNFRTNGIQLATNGGNRVEGCHIGVDAAGTTARANRQSGIQIRSSGNTVGGTTAAARNVISGNLRSGIRIENNAQTNVVTGNYLGTDAGGEGALGNGDDGIEIRGGGNRVGGGARSARNVVSGNGRYGISITGDTTGNAVLGNFVGVGASGTDAVGNGQDGIFLDSVSGAVVGGTAGGEGNVVANNGGNGVTVDRNAAGISIRLNSIHDNAGLGIDLDDNGVTNNDRLDNDNGANGLQNFPVLASASATTTSVTISGTFDGFRSGTFALDFFGNRLADPSGHGEGEVYLGSGSVATDAAGAGSFSVSLPVPVLDYQALTATATSASGETSEFSAALSLLKIEGTVFEDLDGDGSIADGVPRGGVVLRLWLDGGDRTPSGNDDFLFETATSDPSGRYRFDGVPGGTYWVAADSTTVTPSGGWNPGAAAGDVWAEQTWGSAGALCDDGAGGVATRPAEGPCHGGRRATLSDATTLATSEHVAQIVVTGDDVAGADFAFSFVVVVHTLDVDRDTTANRTSQGGFRQFLQNGNAIPGVQSALFRIPTSDPNYDATGNGEYLIAPRPALPVVTDPVVVDGGTQPGFAGRPIVQLAGGQAGNGADGLRITAGSSVVRGLVVNDFAGNGIVLTSGGGNRIEGCRIGTDVPGLQKKGNGLSGVRIESADNVVGGSAPGRGNVLSGNDDYGLLVTGTLARGNLAEGNYVGTDRSGTASVGNGVAGVLLGGGAADNTIGGAAPGAANVVSGNSREGIVLEGAGTARNAVLGNRIGIAASTSTPVPNDKDGIRISNGASDNSIGSSAAGAGNTIGGNKKSGVLLDGGTTSRNVIVGNRIGIAASGAAVPNQDHGVLADGSSTNRVGGAAAGEGNEIAWNVDAGIMVQGSSREIEIRGNSIHENGQLGIDLFVTAAGPTPNDRGDPDTGANLLQNHPVLASAQVAGGATTIVGDLDSQRGTTFTIDFFSSPSADPSGFGEGRVYLGSTTVTTDGGGRVSFSPALPVVVAGGHRVTATATDPAGNSSEFGRPVVVPATIDLSLTKTASPAVPRVGDSVVFTLRLENAPGGISASGVAVLDLLPPGHLYVSHAASPGTSYDPASGRWSVGGLAAGSFAELRISATVQPTGPYRNSAEVVAAVEADADSVPGDGSGDDFASVDAAPNQEIDLALAKTVSDATPAVGSDIVFRLELRNDSTVAANGVVVTDDLPAGFRYLSDDSAASGTSYDEAAGSWTVGTVPPGGVVVLQITVRVLGTGSYRNVAEVAAADQHDVDSVPGDGIGDDYAVVSPIPAPVPRVDLSLVKTADNLAPPIGANIRFKLVLSNDPGASYATGVAVGDPLPAGYAYVSDTSGATGTTYDPASGVWSVGNLAAGAAITLEIVARVEAAGPYANSAEVIAADPSDIDSVPGDGTGDDFATITPAPGAAVDLALTMGVSDPAPAVGDVVVFELKLTNEVADGGATGVLVTDLLPGGYEYVSDDAAASGTSYAPATGEWSVGALPAGGLVVLRVTARVRPAGPYANQGEVTACDQPDLDSVPGDGAGDDFASASTSPRATVDLSIGKTIDDATPDVGATVVFTIAVRNEAGRSDASGVRVSDLLPAGYVYLSDDSAGSGTAYDPAAGVWSVGAVPAGSAVTLRIAATVLPTGPYVNAAEVVACVEPDADSVPADGAGDDYDLVTPLPSKTADLSLAKSVSDAAPSVGSTVVFTLVVSSLAGTSDATGVEVTDLLSAGYAYLSDDAAASGTTYDPVSGIWSVPGVPAGGSRSLRIAARVGAVGPWLNRAEVTASDQSDPDSVPGDGTGDDYADVSVVPRPTIDLSVAKSVDVVAPPVGSTVVFTVVVANASGWSDATGVKVTDLLPGGYVYLSDDAATVGTTYDPASGIWDVGSLAAGASRALRVSARALAGGSNLNAAEVSAADQADADSVPGDGTGDDFATAVTTPGAIVDLSLVKTIDNAAPVVGSDATFTLTLANASGGSDATGIRVTDPLPAGYAYRSDDAAASGTSYDPATGVWSVPTLAAGSSVALRLAARVLAAGPYGNSAEVTAADQPDSDSVPGDGAGDDFSSIAVVPVPGIDLSLAKIVDVATGPVGRAVLFTLTVTNEPGAQDATGVRVRDALPPGLVYLSDDAAATGTTYDPASGIWIVGSFPAGSSVSLGIRARVAASGPFLNAAEVAAADQPDADSIPGDGSGDDFATAEVRTTPTIDLSLSKTVDDPNPHVGALVTFAVTVANEPGAANAGGVIVTDLLPSGFSFVSSDAASSGTEYQFETGRWIVGSVAPGTSKTLRIVAVVLGSGDHTNVAEVTASSPVDADSTPGDGTGDDHASASVAPSARIDLSLTKGVDVPSPTLGAEVVFAIAVSNGATMSPATGVRVEDQLPAGFAYVSDDASANGTSYDVASGIWTVGDLPPGGTRTLSVRARVLGSGPWVNWAQVAAADPPDVDSTPGNGLTTGEDDTASAAVTPAGNDGRVEVPATVRAGAPLAVTVTDPDLDLDPGAAENVSVSVVNEATGETKTVLLVETGPSTGVFAGTVATVPGTTAGGAGDGTLVVEAGQRLTATYADTLTVSGTAATRSDTALVTGGVDGTVSAPETVAAGEALRVTVTDADLDASPTVADVVSVDVTDDATGETESIVLTETGPSTGIFEGTVATVLASGAGAPGDGSLAVRPGEVLTARYLDAFTASGGTATATDASTVVADTVRLEKAAQKAAVIVGEVVGFVVSATNTSDVPLAGVRLEDALPPGFKLVPDSVRLARAGLDGAIGTPDDPTEALPASGARPVSFGPFDLGPGETIRVTYLLRAGAGAVQGRHTNRVVPMLGIAPVGAQASASVEIASDPIFDGSRILGKVFLDADRDGTQDPGEPGIAGATVALDDGTYSITDAHGRYHLPDVFPGQRMVKLDLTTLAAGSQAVEGESRVLWITPGMTARASFAVITSLEESSIGRDGKPGLLVDGEAKPEPVEVHGKAEPMTLLVNDRKVDLAASAVRLRTQGVEDIVVLSGSQLKHPVSFRVEIDRPADARAWKLRVEDGAGGIGRTFAGQGPPPETVDWDGRDDAGDMVRAGEIYPYQIEVVYADGTVSRSPRRLLGVNRDKVVAVELRGEAFASGKAELSAKARESLARVAELLKEHPDEKVVIEGHTDSQGSDESNLDLSRRRAAAAATFLASRGFPAARIVQNAYGESRPVASNDLEEGRELNRRVEVKSQLVEVQSTEIVDRYRTAPRVRVAGVETPVGDLGRFRASVPRGSTPGMEVEISDSQGRSVAAVVPIPRLELDVPRDEVVSAETPSASCRVAEGSGAPDAVACSLRGRTDPGSVLLLDGKPLEVGADGSFDLRATLRPGEQDLGLLVRNPQGYSHSANVILRVSDRDADGRQVVAAEAIPRLTVKLPPDGSRIPSGTLPVTGRAGPGHRVFLDGAETTVASDGSFSGAVPLEIGTNTVTIRTIDPAGRAGEIVGTYEMPKNRLFLLAFANAEAGRLKASGHLEGAGLDESSSTYTDGRLAVYLKGRIAGKYLVTGAFDSGREDAGGIFGDLERDEERRLLTNLDEDRHYSVFGDSSTTVFDVQTQGKLYLALESDQIQALVGNYPLAFRDTELAAYQRTLYGGRFVYRSEPGEEGGLPATEAIVFGAEVRQAHLRDEIRATGGSLYYLSHRDVVEGSEQVALVVRDKNTGLTLVRTTQRQDFDYTVKYPEGRIVFRRPVSSFVEGGSLADPAIRSGHPVFIQVDYEAAVASFEKTAMGGRVRQRLGDRIAVGATYLEDELQSGRYELKGVDAEARLGEGSRLTAEYASSSGADSLTNLSEDGGLTFTQVPAGTVVDGTAWKIAADLDVGEWFGKPNRYQVKLYWKDLEPGFSSNGTLRDQGASKAGLDASLQITPTDVVHLRFDREDRAATGSLLPGAAGESTVRSARWEHRERRWGAALELFDRTGAIGGTAGVTDPTSLAPAGDATYGAGRYWARFGEKWTGRLEHQQTLRGPTNDQTTAGVTYQILKQLALDAQATEGTLGRSAQAGAILSLGETSVYLTERVSESPSQDRTQTVLGARSPLGPASTVYGEYQWENANGDGRAISLVGIQRQWEPGPGLKVVAAAESAKTDGRPQDGGRSSFAAGVSWSRPDTIAVVSRNEVRFESGTARRRQLVTFSQVDWRFDPSLTLQARYRYSGTENRDSGRTEARLEERGIGVAFRPVEHDRFNALGRYSRLSERAPVAAGGPASSSRTIDVFSVETLFQVTPRLEWIGKGAIRFQDEQVGELPATDSTTLLTLQRLNVGIWKRFDFGAEYRILRESGTDDERQGWLTELTWKLRRHLRVGLGYNFTDFSDNEFSRNDYSVQGMFFRVQGWY